MFKDPKIQLALVSFLLFFSIWGILALALKTDAANPFVAFVATSTAAAWNILLIFIKPDGGKPDDQKLDAPADTPSPKDPAQ